MIATADIQTDIQELVSIPDTARRLGNVHNNTVRNLVARGFLERVYVGRRAMITAKSIKRFLENGGTKKAA